MSKPAPRPPARRKLRPGPDWRLSLGFGMEVMGGLAGMGLVGWWLDTKFNSAPWILLSGLLLALLHSVWASLKFMNDGRNPLDKILRKPDTHTPPSPGSAPKAEDSKTQDGKTEDDTR